MVKVLRIFKKIGIILKKSSMSRGAVVMFSGKTLLVVFLMLLTSGCIFEPREPEQPGAGEDAKWVVPLSASDVFLNLTSGFSSASNSNYERSLHDDFVFKPLPQDEAALGSEVFSDWNKSVELEFLTRLKGDYPVKRSIRFGDENGYLKEVKKETNLVEYEGEYRIEVSSGSGVEVFAGKARFIVVQTSLGWMLKLWEDYDIVSKEDPTSGILRGRLRGGS